MNRNALHLDAGMALYMVLEQDQYKERYRALLMRAARYGLRDVVEEAADMLGLIEVERERAMHEFDDAMVAAEAEGLPGLN